MINVISMVADMKEFVSFLNDTILKTDKASMLDEAIEYLKTLQMQVQVNAVLLSFFLKFFILM